MSLNNKLEFVPSQKQLNDNQIKSDYLNLKAKQKAKLLYNYTHTNYILSAINMNPPIIPYSKPIKYYDKNEWEIEITKELNLLEDKNRLLIKLKKILNIN